MALVTTNEGFFKLVPKWYINTYSKVHPLLLNVKREGGVNVKPDVHINVETLKTDNSGNLFKHFHNQGNAGLTFTIDILIRHKEKWNEKLWNPKKKKYDINNPFVTTLLHAWYKNMFSMYVVTDAIDIPNGEYVITNNPTRKQTFDDYTEWALEFTSYNPLTIHKWVNNNARVQKAIKQANAKTTKSASSLKARLSHCHPELMVYTRTKKVLGCNTMMQTVLYNHGFLTKAQIDGWFGPVTMNALKKFQRKFQKTYKLRVTGKMDKATLNCMCKV